MCMCMCVQVVTFDYGMKEKNPIDHVRFYVKEQPHKPVRVRKDQVSTYHTVICIHNIISLAVVYMTVVT